MTALVKGTGRIQSSIERTEDVVFETLIKRWMKEKKWRALELANVLYGYILEEREEAEHGR